MRINMSNRNAWMSVALGDKERAMALEYLDGQINQAQETYENMSADYVSEYGIDKAFWLKTFRKRVQDYKMLVEMFSAPGFDLEYHPVAGSEDVTEDERNLLHRIRYELFVRQMTFEVSGKEWKNGYENDKEMVRAVVTFKVPSKKRTKSGRVRKIGKTYMDATLYDEDRLKGFGALLGVKKNVPHEFEILDDARMFIQFVYVPDNS